MACGEGYGSDVLAAQRRERGRRRRQPRGARARAPALPPRPTCASSAISSRASPSRPMRSCSCRRSSTSRTRARCSSTSARSSAERGTVFVSTPNVLHARAEGRRALGQPLARARVPRRGVRAAVPPALRARWSCSACSTRASCARTSSRCGWAGTRCTRAWGSPSASTTGSRRRSRRSDFALRPRGQADLDRALDFVAVCRTLRSEPRRPPEQPDRRPARSAARWRSCCTRTCPTSRASARGRSARSGCGRRWPAATCRCSSCSTRARR